MDTKRDVIWLICISSLMTLFLWNGVFSLPTPTSQPTITSTNDPSSEVSGVSSIVNINIEKYIAGSPSRLSVDVLGPDEKQNHPSALNIMNEKFEKDLCGGNEPNDAGKGEEESLTRSLIGVGRDVLLSLRLADHPKMVKRERGIFSEYPPVDM